MKNKTLPKLFIILAILLVAAAIFSNDAREWLTLQNLKNHIDAMTQLRAEKPLLTALVFFIVYVLVTAVSFPGATIMTLAGGALFGLGWGLLLVSFASSLGALSAFLASRYLLRDIVQRRFSDRLQTINAGIEKDGIFYLLTLRLVPAFPFFLINLLSGLTPIPAKTFYWVSQVGMLAGTAVYVYAGTQLAGIKSVPDILSPSIIFSLLLLGLFPWIAKTVLAAMKQRRLYTNWKKPSRFDRNLIVIGAGAAGLVTSYIAAAVKAKVTLVEAHKMGGDCLNYGCVPSKALIKSANMAYQIRHASNYGLQATVPVFSFREIMKRVNNVIQAIAPHDSIERYKGLGVEVLQGHARIIDPWTVEIALHDGNTQRLTTRSIVIATGAQPFVPSLPGINDTGYLTSDTLWDEFSRLDTIPARIVVLGGGPIGCELAQAMARLGSGVTLVEHGKRILMREDEEVSAAAEAALRADGVIILTAHTALYCQKDSNGKHLFTGHHGETHRLDFDVLVCATGRTARLEGYGLESLGIETARTVVTNDYLETLYPNIYAAGDVTGPFQFTHAAAHQAWYAAVNALFGHLKKFKVDYRVIPRTTFISPEVACVGLNEQEAIDKGIAHEVTRYNIDDLDRIIIDSAASGFVKVITSPGNDKILGVTIVGEHAGDLLAEFVLAMKWGLGLNKILSTIHTYPTLSESGKYVAGEWKRNHTPQWTLPLLERFHSWRRR